MLYLIVGDELPLAFELLSLIQLNLFNELGDSVAFISNQRSLSEIARQHDSSVGGKAYNLGLLAQAGLSVPDGIVLSALPSSDEEWTQLFAWWSAIGHCPLAARSSALGEDAKDASFAGQLTSVLEIKTEEELRTALATCFASQDRSASRAYREHFQQELKGMNVLVQRMVEPLFSGVFFSRDPRHPSGSWMIEAVEGLGEKLVSGQVTPMQFFQGQDLADGSESRSTLWQKSFADTIAEAGREVEKALGFAVDMEWAIDRDAKFWVLQARPITTLGSAVTVEERVATELERLKASHKPSTLWDGQTFVEWTGLPSPLSFTVWEKAFSSGGAFPQALREMGYLGAEAEGAGQKKSGSQNESLLEQVFGRACLNLNRLQPLFFGKIPYTMIAEPHPHLDFSWRKIDAPTILHAPSAIFRMIKVAWNMQTHKTDWLLQCRKQLEEFRRVAIDLPPMSATGELAADASTPLNSLIERFEKSADRFACEDLKWPFVLAVLAESTEGTLELTLAKDVGPQKAKALLRGWMSQGLSTATARMEQEFEAACEDPVLRHGFLLAFGHRGPGELDLAHARWNEMGEKPFASHRVRTSEKAARPSVQSEIDENVHAIRKPLVEQEWAKLKEILELREELKMEVMRRYAVLRSLALAIAEKTSFGDKVFYLKLEEINRLADETTVPRLMEQAEARRGEERLFSKLAMPVAFSLTKLEDIVLGRNSTPNARKFEGEPLSSGLAYGEVRVVRNVDEVDTESWPENVVLVAEATDPGWTPLFNRACAIVVERGGVLSHCAIVAREMGLPAVSRVIGCTQTLKDGDYVWVDGNAGLVTIAPTPATESATAH